MTEIKNLTSKYDVAHAFANTGADPNTFGSYADIYFANSKVYIRGHHTAIAAFTSPCELLLTSKYLSSTYIEHVRLVARATRHKKVFTVADPSLPIDSNIDIMINEFNELSNTLKNSKKGVKKTDLYKAQRLRQDIIRLLDLSNINDTLKEKITSFAANTLDYI